MNYCSTNPARLKPRCDWVHASKQQMVMPVTIAILAGGKSRRMGQDKSLMPLDDKPLIQHVIERGNLPDTHLILVANEFEKFAHFALPTFPDLITGKAALGGLLSALTYSHTRRVLALACDMPFINKALIKYLIKLSPEFDVVVPRAGNRLHPLHAVYSRACIGPIQAAIQNDELQIQAFYDQVRVRIVEEDELRLYDPELRSLVNLNTPDDLDRLRKM